MMDISVSWFILCEEHLGIRNTNALSEFSEFEKMECVVLVLWTSWLIQDKSLKRSIT